jgi:hypothetical protein
MFKEELPEGFEATKIEEAKNKGNTTVGDLTVMSWKPTKDKMGIIIKVDIEEAAREDTMPSDWQKQIEKIAKEADAKYAKLFSSWM